MPTERPPEAAALVGALHQVLRRGLPVVSAAAEPALLELRGVSARAVDPEDPASRITAADGVLRGALARFPDDRYAGAARALFGLAPAEPGSNLTRRRAVAAVAAGHEVHHFRKRIEPRLLGRLADILLADADRFTDSRLAAPRLAPARERQPIAADPFAWELAEHEELLTRVWSTIYALRAELLGIERLLSLGADRAQLAYAAVTAAWRFGSAGVAARTFTAAFRSTTPTPTPDGLGPEAAELVSLAGWTPPLTDTERALLLAAAADGATRGSFVAALHDETDLSHTWVDGLLTSTRTHTRALETS